MRFPPYGNVIEPSSTMAPLLMSITRSVLLESMV
jgi:hypothetical protein